MRFVMFTVTSFIGAVTAENTIPDHTKQDESENSDGFQLRRHSVHYGSVATASKQPDHSSIPDSFKHRG